MRKIAAPLLLVLLLAAGAFAQKSNDVTQTGKDHFEADFPDSGDLRLDLRSGEIHVRGTDDNKIRVHFEGRRGDEVGDVKIHFRSAGNAGEIHVDGGPRNDFIILVDLPKHTNVYLRVPAGEVDVEGLTGNKDVELHAGDLTVDVGNASNYSLVEASVNTGEIDADAFDVSKGGLFRSFKKTGDGKYKLHAHVGAGQLTLR